MKRKPVIIAYDITSDKRRRRLFSCLKRWKLDAQYSVFECLLTHTEAQELFLQLVEIINEKEDVLLLAWLDKYRKAMGVTKGTRTGFKVPVWYVG
jgi:CRISPR-associated protein Cas2